MPAGSAVTRRGDARPRYRRSRTFAPHAAPLRAKNTVPSRATDGAYWYASGFGTRMIRSVEIVYRNTWHFMWSVHSCHVAKSPLTCPAAAYTCGPRTTASRRVRWVVRLNSRTLYTGHCSFSWRVNRSQEPDTDGADSW